MYLFSCGSMVIWNVKQPLIDLSKFLRYCGSIPYDKENFEGAAWDKLLRNVAKNETSFSVNFPKFSGDFRLSVEDSVLVAKRYNTYKSQV